MARGTYKSSASVYFLKIQNKTGQIFQIPVAVLTNLWRKQQYFQGKHQQVWTKKEVATCTRWKHWWSFLLLKMKWAQAVLKKKEMGHGCFQWEQSFLLPRFFIYWGPPFIHTHLLYCQSSYWLTFLLGIWMWTRGYNLLLAIHFYGSPTRWTARMTEWWASGLYWMGHSFAGISYRIFACWKFWTPQRCLYLLSKYIFRIVIVWAFRMYCLSKFDIESQCKIMCLNLEKTDCFGHY